jgi:hypothetical protein
MMPSAATQTKTDTAILIFRMFRDDRYEMRVRDEPVRMEIERAHMIETTDAQLKPEFARKNLIFMHFFLDFRREQPYI